MKPLALKDTMVYKLLKEQQQSLAFKNKRCAGLGMDFGL